MTREMIINHKKRDESQQLLFPGEQLKRKVRSSQNAAVIVGDVFERMTQKLMGGSRRTTDSTMTVCADTINDKEKLLVESKAVQRGWAFKACMYQLENYEQLHYEKALERDTVTITYCFWTYTCKQLSKPELVPSKAKGRYKKRYKTEGEVCRNIISSTSHVDVLDLHFVLALKQACIHDDMFHCNIRTYESWNRNGRPYWVMHVGHRFLELLRDQPKEAIEIVGLDPKRWTWKTEKKRIAGVKIDGVPFRSRTVKVFRLSRPDGWTMKKEYPNLQADIAAGKDIPF